MKKSFFPGLFLMLCCISARSQYSRFIIQFSDKKNTPYQLDHPTAFLSDRAIQRRAKQHIVLDSTDLPVNPAYLDSLASVGNVSVLNHSKWMNQVLIRTSDSNALAKINLLPFVRHISPIALTRKANLPDTLSTRTDRAQAPFRSETIRAESGSANITSIHNRNGDVLNYGGSFAQIHIHSGEYLHDLGYQGQGMILAILDDGFHNYLSNPAFDSLRLHNQVLGTYDYVNGKTSVNEEDIHGAYCLSILAANEPGIMTGSAPAARYWLLKTEDPFSEYPVEEQNWVAAAEFADSAGADLISTSLGYAYFDDPVFDHVYADRDGRHALISLAANLAVAKGMIVTASAGNSGEATDETRYIECPADADSVLTIGAVNAEGQIAAFSSWGPNAAGSLKPNLVSVGQGTVIAQANGDPAYGDGTSFSNPNLAGLIACLWQAFPEFDNRSILDAVQRSADRFTQPDERYGYGIPDFMKAYRILADQRAFLHYISQPGNPTINLYPVPFTDQFTVVFKPDFTGTARLQLIDAEGRVLETKSIAVTANIFSMTQFQHSPTLARGVYFIHYDDGHQQKTLKTIRR